MIAKINPLLRNFLRAESAGGILLMVAAAVALFVANSPAAATYFGVLKVPLAISIGDAAINKSLLLWINDGLMALFFFLIGLE
ncbi:MAG: Na+/H+ antiporter NhaA, partial [Candidatus Thiodiazotropha sp.]